jgi:hypothetical protein
MTRSYLAGVGTVILAFLVSCAGASAQQAEMQLANQEVKPQTIPTHDQNRLSCDAARKAYNEHSCDKSENVTGECKDIALDLKDCQPYK